MGSCIVNPLETKENTATNPAELKRNITVFSVGLFCSLIRHENYIPIVFRFWKYAY
jgi:hypothetical protein